MRSTVLAAIFVITLTPAAFAQLPLAPPPPPQAPIGMQSGPPAFEFGGHFDYLSLNTGRGDPVLGARFARRHQDWLFTELRYDTNVDPTKGSRSFRKFRVFMANLRLQQPHPKKDERGFVTAGLAVSSGSSYVWSPMVGVGLQKEIDSGLVALRGELQYLPLARNDEGPGRLQFLFGFTLGVR